MTWVMENKNSTPGNRVAVINLKVLYEAKKFYIFVINHLKLVDSTCIADSPGIHNFLNLILFILLCFSVS